eukprot:5972656-Prymnesium_polylepis.1
MNRSAVLTIGADAGITPRIVGGSTATPYAYPWVTAMMRWGYPICGASYLSSNWIISAAHCCSGANVNSLTASLYRHDLSRSPSSEHSCSETIQVTAFYNHPDYNTQNLDSDVCLLRMASVPRCSIQGAILDTGSTVNDGDLLTIAGWGDTVAQPVSGSVGAVASSVLLEAQVPVVPQSQCAGYTTSNMICAGYAAGGVDTCQGDSGGPAFVSSGGSATLVGVVSFGYGCAQPGYPGVYA